MAKARGAIDWFNGSPLDTTHGSAYAIHSHHIFPSSILYQPTGKYDVDNYLHKQIVGELANRAFLTADSNITLSNTKPSTYLAEIESRFPGALARQFVPSNPALWELDRYEEFLAERRKLIAAAINESMEDLVSDFDKPKPQIIEEMIASGESPSLEFKSSLRWDLVQGKTNLDLQKSVLKTIVGFMNTEGGILLIGVQDNGNIFGIEKDTATLGKHQDRDGFEQVLRSIMADTVGAQFSSYAHITFSGGYNRTVCIVRVEASPKPVFLAGSNNSKEFYIRAGNITRALDVEATHDYVNMHWQS